MKYRLLRRGLSTFVHRYVALSSELESYLMEGVGVPSAKVVRICNGVDLHRFRPPIGGRQALPDTAELDTSRAVVIGTVTRLQEVKAPLVLARALGKLVERGLGSRFRAVFVGDGPLREELASELRRSGADRYTWIAGGRDDVPQLLRAFDVFALSSRVEGISNTILEAMASGLPVVATRVGGNDELVVDGTTGRLVDPTTPDLEEAFADALSAYVSDADRRRRHGAASRTRAEGEFGLARMVSSYVDVYEEVISEIVGPRARVAEKETSQSCAG